MPDFLLRALIAILALSLLVGPLGSVAVWRRMGYFGDAASHAALLGVAISLLLQLPIFVGTAFVVVLMALYLTAMREDEQSSDGLLGVIAHGALALSILLLSVMPRARVNLEGYLFGNILTISTSELRILTIATLAILLLLFWRWSALVYTTLNEEMAAAHGLNPRREVRLYTILLAIAVALGIQIVGALLMGAFLIIPAMAARNFARSPEAMAWLASLIAAFSGLAGLGAAYYFNLQTAPAMVVCAVLVFFVSQLRKRF